MPHILMVEDDTDINHFTAEYLRRNSWAVRATGWPAAVRVMASVSSTQSR